MAADEDPYLLDLFAELNATKKALGGVFGGQLQEPITLGPQRSGPESVAVEQPKGLILQTPTLLGKMSHFGRQSGGDSDGSEDSPSPAPRTRGVGPFGSPSWRDASPSPRDSPSSYVYDESSDVDRDTASSNGLWPRRSHSPSTVYRKKAQALGDVRESEALGEAAGYLVSGIYLVSPRRARQRETGPEDEVAEVQVAEAAVIHQPLPAAAPPDVPLEAADEMGQSAQEDQAPNSADPSDSDDVDPSGAFVLETPLKYQIGRPPCMFGRSHVNILAHPDRFRCWFDHRNALSPLAFSLCSHAASGYRTLQMNRLFMAGAAASNRGSLPGFMVLTGRWNKYPDDQDDWQMDSPPHRREHHAIKDLPVFSSMTSYPSSLAAPSGAPGVGAFFEQQATGAQSLEMSHKTIIYEEDELDFSPKKPEPIKKKAVCDRCLRFFRRFSRKQILLFLAATVLCLGLVACLSFLILVLFRVGPYRCSHSETPFTPDDCTRRLRGPGVV